MTRTRPLSERLSLELELLPDRIVCEQDIDDCYRCFELAANEYVKQRLPFDHPSLREWAMSRRFFISGSSTRYLGDYDLERIKAMMANVGDRGDQIPVRWLMYRLEWATENCRAAFRIVIDLAEAPAGSSWTQINEICDRARNLPRPDFVLADPERKS